MSDRLKPVWMGQTKQHLLQGIEGVSKIQERPLALRLCSASEYYLIPQDKAFPADSWPEGSLSQDIVARARPPH